LRSPTFLHALKWSIAGELASRAIQPLVFVLLARLLTPDDYGVVAAAIMVISFTQIFWESGMSKALIQRLTDVDDAANVGFWINLVAGSVIAMMLYFCADLIASTLFHDMRIGNVLRVMTLQIFLGAIASVPTALLQKEMKFNRLFWVRISTVAIPGLFSIPLALYGFSYWSLVIGTLVGQGAQVIVLWKICSWRPKFSFNTALAKELGKFGSWVGLSGLLAWFYLWVDSLFIGAYLGTHQLGLYRTGNQFVTMVFGLLFTPLLPVLYSHFSLMQEDRERLKNAFFKVVRITTFIAIPLAFIMYFLSGPISVLVFGGKWKGIEYVISVMALMHGFSWIVGMNGELYRAIGKPSYETIISSLILVLYLPGYFISIRYGFEFFIWTRFYLALIALALHLYLAWITVKLSIFSIVKIIIIATLAAFIVPLTKALVETISTDPFVLIVLVGGGSVAMIAVLLFLLERNGLVKDIQSMIGKKNNS
jgi:O-antigen/teichoic acid export membrane protein